MKSFQNKFALSFGKACFLEILNFRFSYISYNRDPTRIIQCRSGGVKKMVDKTEISKPIEIKDNSIERVAFDLMEKIAIAESEKGFLTKDQKKRDYWLKLYNQCHNVVDYKGIDIDKLLKD